MSFWAWLWNPFFAEFMEQSVFSWLWKFKCGCIRRPEARQSTLLKVSFNLMTCCYLSLVISSKWNVCKNAQMHMKLHCAYANEYIGEEMACQPGGLCLSNLGMCDPRGTECYAGVYVKLLECTRSIFMPCP